MKRIKRRCVIGLIVLAALLAAGYLNGCLNPNDPRASVCAQGDALRSARLLDAAEEAYADGNAKGEKCAGLSDIERTEAEAEEYFATAGVYASTQPGNAASSKLAIDKFAAGLNLDPFDTKANLGLTLELNKRLVDPKVQCATGANLVDDGLLTVAGVALANGLAEKVELCETTVETLATQRTTASTYLIEANELDGADARDAYASALKANANLAAARTGLEESQDDDSHLDKIGSCIADIPEALKTALTWLVPLAVALFLLALLVWSAIREAAARRSWARKAAERAGRHPGLSFFYKAAVPDIEIAPFEGKGEGGLEGADFSTMLKGEIFKSPARGPAFPFDRVPGGPEPHVADGVTVFNLMTEIPATKLLGSILQVISKLFRRRKVLLTGRLTPPADKGVGVLLSVKAGRGNDASTTLWELVYDPKPGGTGAVRWLRLLPAATIWAYRYLDRAQDPAKHKKLEAENRTKGLKTDLWEAEALLQSAEAWELKGEPARAEPLYAAALEKDPGLLPAAHNLALIEMRRGNHRRALKRVEGLRTVLEQGEPCGRTAKQMRCLWPTLDAASLYTLTLTLAYLEDDADTDQADEDRQPTAIATACTLVSTMARALAAKDKKTRETQEKRKTGEKGKEEETKTAAAKGEEQTEKATEEKREQLLQTLFEVTEAPSVVILASLALKNGEEQDRKTAVEFATSDDADLRDVTCAQLGNELDALKPWELVHGYVERQPDLPRRTYYNLACYYASLLEYAELGQKPELRKRALKLLEAGLVGGELVEWAKKDPSLAPLREFRRYEFTKVLKARTIESHADEKKPADQ